MTIKAIIFDFDGVILESAEIKTEAFGDLFREEYPDKVEEIVTYHKENMGISRYLKFRYYYENLFQQPLSKEKEEELGDRFSAIVLDKILKAPAVKGIEDFLKNNREEYLFFIASGTPDDELRFILGERNLVGYFTEVWGSNLSKTEITKLIMQKHGYKKEEIVFVGDALSDYRAATETGVNFFARKTADNQELNFVEFKIKDFTEFKEILSGFK